MMMPPTPSSERARPAEGDEGYEQGCYNPRRLDAGTKEGHGKAVGYLALFSEIGIILFVTTLGGALAGRWLDEQLGTQPWLLVRAFCLVSRSGLSPTGDSSVGSSRT